MFKLYYLLVSKNKFLVPMLLPDLHNQRRPLDHLEVLKRRSHDYILQLEGKSMLDNMSLQRFRSKWLLKLSKISKLHICQEIKYGNISRSMVCCCHKVVISLRRCNKQGKRNKFVNSWLLNLLLKYGFSRIVVRRRFVLWNFYNLCRLP